MSAVERRRHERVEIDRPVAVRFRSDMLEFEGQATMSSGVVGDVSAGGLFIRSEFLEPPGTAVQIDIDHGDRLVALRGSVRWIVEDPPKGPGMGVEIEPSGRATLKLLR